MATRPLRARTLRRQRERRQAREVRDVKRDLAKRGIYDRCAAVNAVVAPGNRLFWRIYRERVAAREMIVPITKVVEARDIAVKALEELGVDLTDIALRADWQPPTMVFNAVPSYEVAMEAVEARAAKLARVARV
jgi:hypothetical protein